MFCVNIEFSCQHEKVVAKAVDVGNDVCIYLCPFLA